jgi:single-strand DNA-binding protein
MSNISVCVIEGNLTRDAELKHLNSGTAVMNFSLAVNEYRKGAPNDSVTHFFDFVMWGQRAEKMNQYFTKGTGLIVHCTPQQDRWEQDGRTRTKVKFKVEDFSFKGRGREGGGQPSGGSGGSQPQGNRGYGQGGQDFEDDIPFSSVKRVAA